jgi:lipopolysaccharide biosynthesis glycosyltransferase
MPSPIPVVYCFDEGYAPYAAVSTLTLAANSRSALKVYWIVPQEEQSTILPILAAVEQKTAQSIQLIAVPADHFDNWRIVNHISRAGYFRLLIATLIAESRAIYVDADTLVLSDLEPLYSTDMGDHLLAGVPDPGESRSTVPRRDGDPYLNSGVLLMNLDALREDDFLAKAQALYQAHEQELVWIDQCLINKYAEGRKLVVSSRWNRLLFSHGYSEAQLEALLREESPAILHFISHLKPWQRWCPQPIVDFWWRYADQLGIESLKPEPISSATAETALGVVYYLEANERSGEASSIKNKIIEDLIALVKERAPTT